MTGRAVVAVEAAEELWAALVMEWNGDDEDADTNARVAEVMGRWKDRFGTDDARQRLMRATTRAARGSEHGG